MISAVARVIWLRELMRVVLWARPPLEWISLSFLLGLNVMVLRAKLALGHTAESTTVQDLRSTRGRSVLQRDPDRFEGH